MINLKPYGYDSRAAFLRDAAPSQEVMYAMAVSGDWKAEKSVLLHPACPLEVRATFTKNVIWYKRLVAYFATKGPKDFWRLAEADYDKRILAAYHRAVKYEEEVSKNL